MLFGETLSDASRTEPPSELFAQRALSRDAEAAGTQLLYHKLNTAHSAILTDVIRHAAVRI